MTGLNGTDLKTLPLREKRARAREMARADGTLTGTDLDRLFGMKDRWGRKQAAAARNGTQAARPTRGTPERRGTSAPPKRNVPGEQPGQEPRAGTTQRPPERSAPEKRNATTTPKTDPAPEPVPPGILWVTSAAVVLVAAVAAAASFQHMVTLAETVGEERPWLLPISVDGLVLAASMALLVQRRAGRRGSLLAKFALALGLGASLAANVMAVDPTAVDPVHVRRLVAAWPPCSLAIAYELLLSIRSPTSKREAT